MSNQRNLACFIFALLLVASSLIMIEASTASIPTPSVPEFTLRITAHPYDVSPKTTVDPFTGNTETIISGSHQENRSIEVTIKNQPFTPYTDGDGNVISFCYNITFKGHFGSEWKSDPNPYYYGYINASSSEFTVVSFPLDSSFGEVSAGVSVDFEVMALIGYQTATVFPTPWGPGFVYDFIGETSGWSSTQTINVDNNTVTTTPESTPLPSARPTAAPNSSPTQNPTETPRPTTQVGNSAAFEWEQIAIIVVVMLLGVVAVLFAVIGVLLRRKNK